MIEFLSSKSDVVACRVSKEITPEDTDLLTHEMELAFETDSVTHFYYEIDKFLEFSAESVTHGLRHALAMLAHRRELGRVAVVSDDPLLRGLWRVESALLPNLSYRTFKQSQRKIALAWIEEGATPPDGNTVKIIETNRSDVAAIQLAGMITAKDIEAVAAQLNRNRQKEPLKRLLLSFQSGPGLEPSFAFDPAYIQTKPGTLECLDRAAVVGAPEWINSLTALLSPLLKVKIRTFNHDDEGKAWEWLQAKPVHDRPSSEVGS